MALSVIFGLSGGGLGILFLVHSFPATFVVNNFDVTARRAVAIAFAPLVCAAGGVAMGVAVACLFMPRTFLLSTLGRRSLRSTVATDDVFWARLIWFFAASVGWVIAGGILWVCLFGE